MKYVAKHLDDSDNLPKKHPLRDFFEMGALLAVIALLVYGSLGWIAGLMASRISPQTELAWGKKFDWHSEAAQNERDSFLQARLKALLRHTDLPTPPVSADSSEIPNAYVFPGGQIKMTHGLLNEAQTQNEIDFVLAHELGHFKHRHALKGMGRALVLLGLASVTGMDSGAGDLVSNLQNVAYLQSSREAESQADQFALEILFKEHGHVQGSTTFFERMAEKYPSNLIGSFFSTHPLSETRVDELHALAISKGWPSKGKVVASPFFIKDPQVLKAK